MLFQWTSLGSNQFRLLQRRLPLPDGTPSYIHKTFSFSSPSLPAYTAIFSHESEAETKKDSVILNGRSYGVPEAAVRVLKQVEAREGEGNEYLWIECLCVRTGDGGVERRRLEVSMGKIVEDAKNVVAWMGDDEVGAKAFCDAAQGIQNGGSPGSIESDDLESFVKSLQALGRLSTGEALWDESAISLSRKVILYAGYQRFESVMVQRVLEALHGQKIAPGKKENASAAASL